MCKNKIKLNFLLTIALTIFCLGIFVGSAQAAEHFFTGLPFTSDGWTDLEALVQSDSRIIYVSTSGNDATTTAYNVPTDAALSGAYSVLEPNEAAISPYQTLAAGYAQLRSGYPDFLLLKRGDSWSDEGLDPWNKSGESRTKRMVFGAYGSEALDRPTLGKHLGLRGDSNNYLVITSLKLASTERSMTLESENNHVLLEDLYSPPTGNGLSGSGATGIAIHDITEPHITDWVAIRRCVIAGRYRELGVDGYNQGLFIGRGKNLLIEENIFDDNGHSHDGVASNNDIRAHNTYITLYSEVANAVHHIFRGNMSSRASADGLMPGSGGTTVANLSVTDPIGIAYGKDDAGYHGVSGIVKDNVVLHGIDTNENNGRGWGIVVENSNGVLVEDNIIAGNTSSAGGSFGIRMVPRNRLGEQMYIRDVTIRNNIIHEWTGASAFSEGIYIGSNDYLEGTVYTYGSDPDDFVKDIKIIGNDISVENINSSILSAQFTSDIVESSGNTFYSNVPANDWFRVSGTSYNLAGYKALLADTTSTSGQSTPSGAYGVTDYLSSLGDTATLDAYYAKLRSQRKGNWDNNYTALPIINFVRDKFGRDPVSYSYSSVSNSFRADVDGSSEITTTDALLTLRNSLGLSMNGTAWRASATTGDVNCDGVSNSTDALLILRYSLGLNMGETGWCE